MLKKILILLFLVLWALPAFADLDTAWVRRYNGPGNSLDLAHAIAVDGSGNVYVTGESLTDEVSFIDYVTIKYDASGNQLWVKRYNGPGNTHDQANAISVDESGNVYVTGWSAGSGTSKDYATIKYDASGNELWVRRYDGLGGSDWDVAFDIAIDACGNAYVTGYSMGSGTDYDYATIKYYPNGDVAWVKRYNGPGNSHDVACAMAVDGSGHVYVTGLSAQNATSPYNEDCATIKYDTNGNELWVRRYNGPGDNVDEAYAIAIDGSGNVHVTGASWDSDTDYDYTTIKYDASGNELWVRGYDGPENFMDVATAIAVDGSGNVYVTGYSAESNEYPYNWDYATIKYDASGNELWVRRYNGPGNSGDNPTAIAVDDYGNAYVTGGSEGSETLSDYATLKYDPVGNEVWIDRYDGPASSNDGASDIMVDDLGNVYVTGYSHGSGTATDYTTIKYQGSLEDCVTLQNITVCADSVAPLSKATWRASGNVRIGDATGELMYLELGIASQLDFDDDGNVWNIAFSNPTLEVKTLNYLIETEEFSIDASNGEVSFAGQIHTLDNAIAENSLHALDFVVELNAKELHGSVEFDDPCFGQIGIANFGSWDFEGCPFFGIQGRVDVSSDPLDLVDQFSVINGNLELGIFMNTGIIRVGIEHGVLEFSALGGGLDFNLSHSLIPAGPTEGTVDIDLADLGVNVVRDIPITIPFPAKAGRASRENTHNRQFWRELNGEKAIVIDPELTIKGEEWYEDKNCNGQWDPDEPFVDENSNGVWDSGTHFYLWDSEAGQPQLDALGRAVVTVKLAQIINFEVLGAEISAQWPDHRRIDFESWAGAKFGSVFNLDYIAGGLHLDYENALYSGELTFHPVGYDAVSFLCQFTIDLNPVEFLGTFEEDIQIFGIDLFTANAGLLFNPQDYFVCITDVDAFGILTGGSTAHFDPWEGIYGSMNEDFQLGGYKLFGLHSHFSFDNQTTCLTGHARIKWCPYGACISPEASFTICNGLLKIFAGGLWFWLGPKSPPREGSFTNSVAFSTLHLYDSYGNHVGMDSLGNIENQIANSEFIFDEESGQQLIYIPTPDLGAGYEVYIDGFDTSMFDFALLVPNSITDSVYLAQYFDHETSSGALHKLTLVTSNDWLLGNDLDGDSVYESWSYPDSLAQELSGSSSVVITNVRSQIQPPIGATVSWETNVPATSEISYRLIGSEESRRIVDTTIATTHSLFLDSLKYDETYVYNVASRDSLGTYGVYIEKELTFTWEYTRGDANSDGEIDIADVVYLINYLFISGPAPVPLEAGDANCDGVVDIADVVYLINYLFIGGPPPCGA